MKRVTFFILALIAIVIADDESIELDIAKQFKCEVTTLQACLDKEEVKIEQLSTSMQKLSEVKWDDINEDDMEKELEQAIINYASVLACILEKHGMMVDTKLVADKIYESMKKDEDMNDVMPQEEDFMKCVNSLNENSELTREQRACSLFQCIFPNKKSR